MVSKILLSSSFLDSWFFHFYGSDGLSEELRLSSNNYALKSSTKHLVSAFQETLRSAACGPDVLR